jgi:hypothetical protein
MIALDTSIYESHGQGECISCLLSQCWVKHGMAELTLQTLAVSVGTKNSISLLPSFSQSQDIPLAGPAADTAAELQLTVLVASAYGAASYVRTNHIILQQEPDYS